MSLIAIKQYMLQVKKATLDGLCRQFNAEPDTMRCLLQHWIAKGKLRQCMKKSACGTRCFQCPSAMTEMYEWVDEASSVFA